MSDKPSHGGARAGAGRKKTLDYLSEIHIGARAHNLQAKLAERRALLALDEKLKGCGIKTEQGRAKAILRQEGIAHWESSCEGEEVRENIEFGLAELHGDPDMENPPRGITLLPSAYGTRERCLAVVSRWASWRYRQPVSPERVRKCLKTYRTFLRAT